MRQIHRDVTGDAPPESERPSSDQLAALKTRLEAGESPYVDFALWTPFGKRGAKLRKFDGQVFVDNELRNRQLAGPSNFDAWLASWKVFRAAMIMHGAASPAVLDKYANGIRDLAKIHPSSWGIIFVADELNRFERWENIFEELQDSDDEFRKQAGFKSDFPWNTVIKLSTFGVNFEDYSHWWFLHVLSVASGKGSALAAELEGSERVPDLSAPGGRTQPSGRQKRAQSSGTPKAAGTRSQGRGVCYAWNNGGCSSGQCPNNFMHTCRECKGPHRATECPNGSSKGKNNSKGGKGKGGKGSRKGKNHSK